MTKRPNPLIDLFDLIEKGHMQKDILYQGKTYTFRSLNDEDYTWRDQFMNTSGPASIVSSQRAPTLAIATVKIDGIPVEEIDELSKPEEQLPLALQEFVAANIKFLIAYNLYKKVYALLPREYITGLHRLFLEQVESPSRTVKPEEIKNS